MEYRKVITYGTFDCLHYGHIHLLRRAKELGNYLVVAISTDDFNVRKGKKAIQSLNERLELLNAIKYVDEIIFEENWEQKVNDVITHDISVFVMGDDWRGEFDFLSTICSVVYLERTKSISSTKIRKIVKED